MSYTPSNQTLGYSQEIEDHVTSILKRNKNLSVSEAIEIVKLGITAQKLDLNYKFFELLEGEIPTLISSVMDIKALLCDLIGELERK
jgi:hypothetical protein